MPAPAATEPPADPDPPVTARVQVRIYVAVLVLVAVAEAIRWAAGHDAILAGWLCGEEADWLPFLPWLLAAPLFWHRWSRHTHSPPREPRNDLSRAWACALLVAVAALAASISVAGRMDGLPPAYHDEFSYLFQARTFAAGRLWFPGFEPMPELFDQMHVLNEGRFASRFFPGVGLWMAPFVAAGNPWLAHWVANALAAFFLFWAGREIGGSLVGLVAGLLFAASPGIALFSDLLLAHHPTLVGLMLFLWAFLRMKRTGSIGCALVAGTGLTFAMLCRPMTAAGIGLPFGIWFAWWLITGRGIAATEQPATGRRRVKTALGLGGPILCGLIAMSGYSKALTGDPWTTPYQLYTDIYTPRHVYGFNNVVRGEQRLGPKVLEHYDIWAENLDAELAVRNVRRRTLSSLRWTLGVVPLLAATLVLLFSRRDPTVNVGLVGGAVIGVHLVHVPYWFEGIMGWHYVFESAPFWLLLFAVSTVKLGSTWVTSGRYAMPVWWAGLALIALAVNLATLPQFWPGRLPRGIVEVSFSRKRYAEFEDAVEQVAEGRSVIIFVEPDVSDRHIDYVVNVPALDADVLFARYRPDRTDLARARALFPEREAYLYRAASNTWSELPRPDGAAVDP